MLSDQLNAPDPRDDLDTLEGLLAADLDGHPRPERIRVQLQRLERLVDHAPDQRLQLGRHYSPDAGPAGQAARALLKGHGLQLGFDTDAGWRLARANRPTAQAVSGNRLAARPPERLHSRV